MTPPIANLEAFAGLRADIRTAIDEAATLQHFLQRCTDAVVGRCGAAFARIWTLDAAHETLELQASSGLYVHLNGPHSRVRVGQYKIGLIAAERRPHVSNDVVNDPRVSDRAWAQREGMRSFAGFPLLSRGRLHGVVAMFSKQLLSEGMLQALESVSELLADELDRRAEVLGKQADALRLSQMERAALNDQLAAVTDALTGFLQSGDLRQASALLLHAAIRQTESQYGFIGTAVDLPAGKVLRVYADEGFFWDPTVNRALYEKVMSDYATKGFIEFPRLDNLFGRVILDGQALISNDPANDPRGTQRRPPGHPPLDGFMGVPIMKSGECVGMFGVANRPGGYTAVEHHRIDTLARAASVIYDVALQRRRHAELEHVQEATREQLRTAVNDLQGLARVMSHELQDPVSRIRGYLNLLAARYRDRLGSDADEFIGICVTSAEAVDRIVGDLWTYARACGLPSGDEECDGDRVLSEVLASLEPKLREAGGRWERRPIPKLRMGEWELGQVLRALLDNAITHRGAGAPVVAVQAEVRDGACAISVRDNGKGITPIFQKDVFKLLFRIDGKSGSDGTGMGLAIAHKIVEQAGGRFTLQSTPGLGSTFTFTVPLA